MEQNRRGRRPVGILGGAIAATLIGSALATSGQSSEPQHAHNRGSNSRQAGSLPPASDVKQPPAPVIRQAPPGSTGVQAQSNSNPAPSGRVANGTHFTGSKGEHLDDWMRAHNNLSPAEQQNALGREPGFRDLPPETQQRMRDRLSQLSRMTPEQRQRTLEHNEAMERLSPPQRAEVRSAMLQLGALPPDQRKVVSRAFRSLRGLPPDERLPMLNSRYRNLTAEQRFALQHLMQVEPILPPDSPGGGPPPMPPR